MASGNTGTAGYPCQYARHRATEHREGPEQRRARTRRIADTEKAAFASLAAFYKKGAGYAAIMNTRRKTIGYSLADSPAGMAAFYYDKFAAWSSSGENALQSSLAAKDRNGAAGVLSNLAALHYQMGDLALSEHMFRQAIEEFRKVGNPDGVATSLSNFAASRLMQGDLAGSQEITEKSRSRNTKRSKIRRG
jgi:tetratricopeptide (TPR) repeat protein